MLTVPAGLVGQLKPLQCAVPEAVTTTVLPDSVYEPVAAPTPLRPAV
jgi:hypothetical protein